MAAVCSNKAVKSCAYSLPLLRWRPFALGRKIMLGLYHSIAPITRGFPMKAWIPLTLVFALGFAAHARADCSYPKSPDAPPDGSTATKEEMVAAAKAFKSYNTDMNAYLDCLQLEIDAAVPKDQSKLTPDEKKKLAQQQQQLTLKHNAAVDELQAVVGRFNEQLRIYKAKQTS
jgi:hypothetical protein